MTAPQFSEKAVEAAARAMEAKRAELQHAPLARIYDELASACLSAALAVDGMALVDPDSHIKNSFIKVKDGETADFLFRLNETGCVTSVKLDGYAVVPREDWERLASPTAAEEGVALPVPERK